LLRQVSLKLDEETSVQSAAKKHDARITVLDCKELNKKDMDLLIDISSATHDPVEVASSLRAEGVFKKVYAGAATGRTPRSLSVGVLENPGLCRAVRESGAFCLSCPYSASEGGEWNVLVKDSGQLKGLISRLEDLKIGASIGGVSDPAREESLTSRQEEILAKAISLGYFEFPRRFSLTELSRRVGIKPSTLSQVLRAAEEKVMARYAAEANVKKVTHPPADPL
jgi:predicted DNA binding protein